MIMEESEPGDAVKMVEILDRAISEAVQKRDEDDMFGGVLVRWVVVADVMATNGTRNLRIVTPEDTTVWEAVGMLESAKTEVDPAIVVLDRE